MLKPPPSNIPGMTDTLEFVKNLWGSMNVPGAGVPGMGGAPLSTDELDKKIADLKAVESWLNMNTTMLRGTIQALEVQRGTIASFKSMSASMAQAMGQAGEQAATPNPFAQFFSQPGAGAAAGQGPAEPKAQPEPKAQAEPQAAAQGGAPGVAAPAAGLPAAVAWWNLLQDQFTQAVTSALSPEAIAAAGLAAGQAQPAEEQAPPAKPGAPKARQAKPGPDKA
jgi:hypothetical protein